MSQSQTTDEAINLLQELGLKEYEARCYVALTQLQRGSAKEISEISDVPRTRVYDAIRVLESQGLVEVQHGNPQLFRAVAIDEATETIRQQYDDRLDTLETSLDDVEHRDGPDEDELVNEVWSLSGHEAIESRTYQLVENAESEIVLLVVDETLLTEELFDRLRAAVERDVSVVVGGLTDAITTRIRDELPSAQVFETGLEWVVGPTDDTEVGVGRLLLTDRTSLLVSTFYPVTGEDQTEQAVFSTGLRNGVVVLIRRLLATGLPTGEDPGTEAEQ